MTSSVVSVALRQDVALALLPLDLAVGGGGAQGLQTEGPGEERLGAEGGSDVGAAGGQVGGAVAGGRGVDGWRENASEGRQPRGPSQLDIVSTDDIKREHYLFTLSTPYLTHSNLKH